MIKKFTYVDVNIIIQILKNLSIEKANYWDRTSHSGGLGVSQAGHPEKSLYGFPIHLENTGKVPKKDRTPHERGI